MKQLEERVNELARLNSLRVPDTKVLYDLVGAKDSLLKKQSKK